MTETMTQVPLEQQGQQQYTPPSLPTCTPPPSNEFLPVEQFVSITIRQRTPSSTPVASSRSGTGTGSKNAISGYSSIIECLHKRDDPSMLWKILLALRSGPEVLTSISANPEVHAHLLHLILKLDPFEAPLSLRQNTPLPPELALELEAELSPEKKRLQRPLSARKKACLEKSRMKYDEMEEKRKEKLMYYKKGDVADAHLNLVVALISANCSFLVPGLEMMWRAMVVDGIEMGDSWSCEGKKSDKIHAAIATTLRLVPRGRLELSSIVQRIAPHRSKPSAQIDHFARQCLELVKYVPHLHADVLSLLINKALEIDVEIKINDGGQVTVDDEKEEGAEVFELDEDQNEDRVDEMADKLDSLMVILFEHLSSLSPNQVYTHIIPIFTSSILPTHKSKYVQFLLLYLLGNDAISHPTPSTLNAHLHRHFAAYLINTILDSSNATNTRQTAACYLASFISRANYVDSETVCETVAALLRWSEVYVSCLTPGQLIQGGGTDHALFYAVCQAAFYIMCFRGPEALSHFKEREKEDEQGIIHVGRERWDYLCQSGIYPLSFCLESVRREFLLLAETHDLLSDQVLENMYEDEQKANTPSVVKRKTPTKITVAGAGKRNRSDGGVGGLGRGQNPLDSFFPFDPYLLRNSFMYVETFYTDWNPQHSDDDDIIDDDNARVTDIEEDEHGMDHHDDVQPMSYTKDDEDDNCMTLKDQLEAAQRTRAQSITIGCGSW